MRPIISYIIIFSTLFFSFQKSALASFTAQEQKEIFTFTLNKNFLDKLYNLRREMQNFSFFKDKFYNDSSIKGLINNIKQNKILMPLLEKEKLTPKDYVVGFIVLKIGLIYADSIQYKDPLIIENQPKITEKNKFFIQKNRNYIEKILDT